MKANGYAVEFKKETDSVIRNTTIGHKSMPISSHDGIACIRNKRRRNRAIKAYKRHGVHYVLMPFIHHSPAIEQHTT